MAKINRSDIVNEIVKQIGLDTSIDKLPNEMIDKVMPVIVANRNTTKILEVRDDAANDSNKTITVPVGKQWKLLYAFIQLGATATVGNRQMRIELISGTGVFVWLSVALNVQTANQTEFYMLAPGIQEPTEALATHHFLPMPRECLMEEGSSIVIRDAAAVDAAADDLNIRLIVEETDAITRGF